MPSWDLAAAAVLFDMDGTLVDSTAVVEAVWAQFATRFDLDLSEVLAHAHGRQTSDTVAHFCPPGLDQRAVTAELDAQELVVLDGIVEIPGAAALLAELAGAPVAVVTSASRELATRRMRAAGIHPPDVLVCAEDVTVGKPSPEGYQKAAALLGVPSRDAVVFEDAEAGVRAGRAAGGPVVVVGGLQAPIAEGLPRVADLGAVRAQVRAGQIRLSHRG